MEHTESRAALLRMQYLGTLRARGGPLAAEQWPGTVQEKGIFTLFERRERKRAE